MNNFKDYDIKDLFRIKDCQEMLADYGLEDTEMLREVKYEILKRGVPDEY